MSDTPVPTDENLEFNAVETLLQTAWDRFAASDSEEYVEGEDSDETPNSPVSDDDGQQRNG